jgi:hypothetical protein
MGTYLEKKTITKMDYWSGPRYRSCVQAPTPPPAKKKFNIL